MLYLQNGGRVVNTVSVTSFHPCVYMLRTLPQGLKNSEISKHVRV